jgi:hypothetical protein
VAATTRVSSSARLSSERDRGLRDAALSRSGTRTAFIASRTRGSTSSRLPIWRATANATRPQSRAILSELASSSRRLASLYAASPKSRISASVSVSKRSILARRWGNQDNIGDSLGIRLTASYVSCMHLQMMLSRRFPRQSTNGKQSTGALLHASRRDAVTGRGMLRKQPLEIHQDSARYAPRIVA